VPLSDVRVAFGPHANEVLFTLVLHHPAWDVRVHTLEGLGPQEEDPTIMVMASYLLALDSLCDQQCAQARSMAGRTELSERRWRKSRVELAKYEACAVHAESQVMALEDELSDQVDRNNRLLRGVCLLEHVYRREHHIESTNPPILDGFVLPHAAVPPFRMSEPVPLAPPLTPCDEGADDQDMFVDGAKPEDRDP
jgi:hypothetical protein